MNVELISVLVAVVAVGASLAGLMLAGLRSIRREMQEVRQEVRHEVQHLRDEVRQDMRDVREDMRDMRTQIGDLRERMGRVEGLLQGFRDVLIGRTASD